MSFAEIKDSIESCTLDQRLELAALIANLNRAEDPAYAAELDQRMADMDAGRKISQLNLEALHRKLSAQGK